MSVKPGTSLGTKTSADLNYRAKRSLTSNRDIPDVVYQLEVEIDGNRFELNLQPILEIDVTELSELTLANLRIQLEKISSIRMTLERAYEQSMEDYGKFKIAFDIWWSEAQEKGRLKYWEEQELLRVKYNLAKSGMKPPTQDDLMNTVLRSVGLAADYELRQEKMIKYQRTKSLFENIDKILNSREFNIKTIMDSRVSKAG